MPPSQAPPDGTAAKQEPRGVGLWSTHTQGMALAKEVFCLSLLLLERMPWRGGKVVAHHGFVQDGIWATNPLQVLHKGVWGPDVLGVTGRDPSLLSQLCQRRCLSWSRVAVRDDRYRQGHCCPKIYIAACSCFKFRQNYNGTGMNM
jgi:hypothetical protein